MTHPHLAKKLTLEVGSSINTPFRDICIIPSKPEDTSCTAKCPPVS